MFSLNFLGNYEPKRVSAASSSLCTHRDTDNTAVSVRPNSAKGPGERESPRAHNGASVLKGGTLSRSREVKNRSEEGAFLPWILSSSFLASGLMETPDLGDPPT